MKNRLAGLRICIDNGSVACAVDPLLFRHSPDNRKQMTQQRFIALQIIIQRSDVLAWNDQQVNRGFRINVLKRDTLFVLKEDPGWFFMSGHLTENASGCIHHSSSTSMNQLLESTGKHMENRLRVNAQTGF
jgi:hypothetical protein